MINRITVGLIKKTLYNDKLVIFRMKFVQQTKKLRIHNFDTTMEKAERLHSVLLPNNVRCLIVGPSNSGKTSVMLNLLFDPNGLRFANVYVFSKSLYQPKYGFLERVLTDIPDIEYYKFSENEQVIHPNDAKPNSIIIFDDVACERQENIVNYFTMGRHKKINVFYLCQTYSKIPKQLIRDNANVIVIFCQDEHNLKLIFRDHVIPDLTFELFKEICSKAWSERKKGFLVIDKESDINCGGRYRIGFDIYINNL